MEAARAVPRTARHGRQGQPNAGPGPRPRAMRRRAARRRHRITIAVVLAVLLTATFVLAARRPGTSEPPPARGRLLLNEQFTGDTLNSDHWSPCYWWATDGCTNLGNENLQWYVPGQVKVGGGKLSLEARPEQVTGVEGRQFDYVSGLISGRSPDRTLFAFQYGYVESRIKVPEGRGLWPALWLMPTTESSLPEVDILEIVGEKPDELQMHTHWEQDGERESAGKKWDGPNFSEDWHTFGLAWEPDSLTWYVDGVARWQVTDRRMIPDQPMYLITNLAVGGEYTTRPSAATEFPATLEVDYVKVWGAP